MLLGDVLENFRKMCLEIYELDLAKLLSGPILPWQAVLKKDWRRITADIAMLLMVEKGLREGICHSINRYNS